ncbi:hypothetical protein ACIP1T_19760 [Pseudomonas japonica]|uniref:hypothetical protein n=1 Tax=Pseudomonas japonica TaxID=256466 RepID=UPI0037F66FB2
MQAHGFAFLAGPIDFTIGTVFNITGITLLLRPRLFSLFTTVLQLLTDFDQLRARFIALPQQFLPLLAQVVDLRMALSQQLLQVGQAGFRALPSAILGLIIKDYPIL